MQQAQLFDNIVKSFNSSELKTLCFKLDIDYDSLAGASKEDKARELITHCQRHNLISNLILQCQKDRPNVHWDLLPEQSVDSSIGHSSSTISKPDRYLKFQWAREIKVNRERLKTAKFIDWMAVSNSKTLGIYRTEITHCLDNGGRIRLLLVHPESEVCHTLEKLRSDYKTAQDIKNQIILSLKMVKGWQESIPGCDLNVRFILGQPPHRLMIVNRGLESCYIRLRWVTVGADNDIPTVVFSRRTDPNLLEFVEFVEEQFEAFWQLAKTDDIKSLIKNHEAR